MFFCFFFTVNVFKKKVFGFIDPMQFYDSLQTSKYFKLIKKYNNSF